MVRRVGDRVDRGRRDAGLAAVPVENARESSRLNAPMRLRMEARAEHVWRASWRSDTRIERKHSMRALKPLPQCKACAALESIVCGGGRNVRLRKAVDPMSAQ